MKLSAGRAAEGDGLVVPHDPGANLHHAFAHDGIYFAGHDGAAGLTIGQLDFEEAAARSAGEPADIVSDVEQRDGDGSQHTATLDEAVALRVGFEMVDGFDEFDAGVFFERGGDSLAEFGMGVDAGADGGAASGEFEDGF